MRGRSPDKISHEEVRSYLHYLIVDRKLAGDTCNGKVVAIRFFYQQVLGQQDFALNVRCKRPARLPEPISRQEVCRLFEATNNVGTIKPATRTLHFYCGTWESAIKAKPLTAESHEGQRVLPVRPPGLEPGAYCLGGGQTIRRI